MGINNVMPTFGLVGSGSRSAEPPDAAAIEVVSGLLSGSNSDGFGVSINGSFDVKGQLGLGEPAAAVSEATGRSPRLRVSPCPTIPSSALGAISRPLISKVLEL